MFFFLVKQGTSSFKQKVSYLRRRKKNKKREYSRERYKNLSEEEKQMLVAYGKRYYETQKNNCKIAQKDSRFLPISVKMQQP